MKTHAQWIQKDERCWVCDEKDKNPYRKAIIQSVQREKCRCRFEDGHTEDVKFEVLEPRSGSDTRHQDLMDIDKLSNAELLYNLSLNFAAKEIYTYCGASLVALNPYHFYPQLYSKQLQEFYIQEMKKDKEEKAAPHVYTVALQAVKNLQKNGKNQSILISGQSGAGKTEANKEVLKLLGKFYGAADHAIEQKIAACNPLLESFGNAKTIRNDNSSRFGKYIQVMINSANSKIVQARIVNYLLQKSRLISQLEGQRNFHIFYYFLKGMKPMQLEKYGITNNTPLNYFEYLKDTSFLAEDGKMLQQVRDSIATLPFQNTEDAVWKVIASILHLGNVVFKENEGSKCQVVNTETIRHICKLLEINETTFIDSLVLYRIRVNNDSVDKYFNLSEIKDIKDSVAKALYERLFSWLVQALNKNFASKITLTSKQLDGLSSIGLLDIYGFEVLKTNSFEQLCINFTNERLHQLYILEVFKAEKAILQQEGLSAYLHVVQYRDNQPLIDMLDTNTMSVFNLIDEWCSVASPDQQSYLTNVRFHHKKNEFFPHSNLNNASSSLIIRHTPREIEYNVKGFREKNRNLLREDVQKVLKQSKLWLIKQMFSMEQPEGSLVSTGTKVKKFLGSKFRQEMNNLIMGLQKSCQLHFIRCIKANGTKEPSIFDQRVVLEQIKYLSILETIQVRRRSYCIRYRYEQFIKKYEWYDYLTQIDGTPRDKTMAIIKRYFSTLTQQDILFGNTRLFLKDYAAYRINIAYKKKLTQLKIACHKIANVFIRHRYNQKKKRKLKMKKQIEQYLVGIKDASRIERMRRAVRVIENAYLRKKYNQSISQYRLSIISLQSYFRRIIDHKSRIRKLVMIQKIQSFFRRKLLKRRLTKYIKIQHSINYILNKTMRKVEHRMLQRLHPYLKTWACIVHNRQKIKKSVENEIQNYRKIYSRKIEKFIYGMLDFRRYRRFMNAVLMLQRRYRSNIVRNNFLKLRRSIIIIQRAYREYYFKKVESRRIFNKFFEVYISKLTDFNEYVRQVLFGTKKHGSVDEIVKAYLNKFHNKMSLFYYMVDFEAHIDLEEVYPSDSWLHNYLKLYKESFQRSAPMQQIQVGETMTVASTTNRLYSWGSLCQDVSEKIQPVNHKGQLLSYKLFKDNLQINPDLNSIRVSTTKKQFRLSKHVITHTIKEMEIPIAFPKQDDRKAVEIACGNGHVICRTSNHHVYTWGHGGSGELGHGQLHNQDKPRIVEGLILAGQLAQAMQVAATYSSSIVLMSNRKILWFGTNGTLKTISVPTQLHLQTKARCLGSSENYSPIKLVVSWSKTMSTVGLTILSYNNVLANNLALRQKIVNLITTKWQQSGIQLINPPYAHNLANYIHESSIKLPATKQQSEMESRKALRDMEQQIREALKEDSVEISFSNDNPLFK